MRYFIFLALLLVLEACSSTQNLQRFSNPPESFYHLGAGDTIKVTVFGENDLTGTYILDSQGMIALPLVNKVSVDNQTEQKAADTISSVLRKNGYLKNPKVSIEITSMRPFYVLGEVEKRGKFPYQPDLNVYQAIAIAGGYTYRADRDDIVIHRRMHRPPAETGERLIADESTLVLPGDVIEVGERFF